MNTPTFGPAATAPSTEDLRCAFTGNLYIREAYGWNKEQVWNERTGNRIFLGLTR